MTSNAVRQPDERAKAIEAVKLRRSGLPFREIAEQLGYADESGARKAVTRLLDRTEAESVDELRALEGARLDALQAAHWDAAVAGDTDAAKLVLGIVDRRCRLLGLNAPTAVSVSATVTDVEFAEQAAELISAMGGSIGELIEIPGAQLDAPGSGETPEGDRTLPSVFGAVGAVPETDEERARQIAWVTGP